MNEKNELTPERAKGWQDVIDYLENEIATIDDRTAGSPHLKAVEGIVLKTVVYALKEGREAYLAKAKLKRLDRPELREKIERILTVWEDANLDGNSKGFISNFSYSGIARELLALLPDEKQIRKQEMERIDSIIFNSQHIEFRKGKSKYDNGWNNCRQWVYDNVIDKVRHALKEG